MDPAGARYRRDFAVAGGHFMHRPRYAQEQCTGHHLGREPVTEPDGVAVELELITLLHCDRDPVPS